MDESMLELAESMLQDIEDGANEMPLEFRFQMLVVALQSLILRIRELGEEQSH